MRPWLNAGVWAGVASELGEHRERGLGGVLTEDVLRFATARALATAGCKASGLRVERAHPMIPGSRIDLAVGEPEPAVIEFKYPREPNETNAAWTMALGEVLKDFYRLALYPGRVDRIFVLAATSRLRRYLGSSAERYGMDIDRELVNLGPQAARALPKTAAQIIGEQLAEHHVTARRLHLVDVDRDLYLAVYSVDPIASRPNAVVALAEPPRTEAVQDRATRDPWSAITSRPPGQSATRPTIWEQLAQCVTQLDEPFRRSEIIGWFRRHYPETHEASLAAHIQTATSNGGHATGQFAHRVPLLTRIEHGLYARFRA